MSLFLKPLIFLYSLFGRIVYGVKVRGYARLGVKLGKNVRLYGTVDGVNPHLVEIGDNVVVGKGSSLIAHCPVRGGLKVKIGNNVWLGYGVLVLPGVTIGENSIVGAGSVVTKDIPPNSIAAGNPARVLKERDQKELERTVRLIKEGKSIGYVERT